jgi:hypothetical protein
MSGPSAIYDEPADWIVEQARGHGVSLSRRKLADWHRAGLVREPDRQFLGGPDGSQSIYPRGTLPQAIACARLMKQFGSLKRVGWELWRRGFPVAERHWRDPLRKAHKLSQLFFSMAIDREDEDSEEYGFEQSDAVDRLIATAGRTQETPQRLGVARRRLRGDRFSEFLSIVVSSAIGAFEISESTPGGTADPRYLLSRLLGTVPANHQAAPPTSPLLSVTGKAVAENLATMARFLPRIASSVSSDDIAESAFASSRDELTFLAHAYLSIRENEARIAPGSTPDLPLLRQLFQSLRPEEQVGLLLIWLVVHDSPGWRENLDTLRQAYLRGRTDGKGLPRLTISNGRTAPGIGPIAARVRKTRGQGDSVRGTL